MFDFAQPVRNFNRWREVQAILFRYGFDFLTDNKEFRRIQSYLKKTLNLQVTLLSPSELSKFTTAQRVRLMLQELGPTYIKLGQILSSRRDILPRDWTIELSKLQDEVPAFPFEDVRDIIEEDLGAPLEELFIDFDPQPVAAASIAQVHRATLPDLNPVVVKVRRPKITTQVQSDMEIIRDAVRLIEGSTKWAKRYGLSGVIEEFGRTLALEMDFRNEAANAIRLRNLMSSFKQVHVPYVYWNLTAERVMTMEYIQGVKINDLESLDKAGVDRTALANVFIRSIFKQLLIDGFFHADPHPANLFVNLENHKLIYLDLGMMGTLLPEQRQQLGDVVRAIIRRDSRDVMRIIMTIGTPFDKVDEKSLRRSIDHIINRYLDTSLENISFSTLLSEVLMVIFGHNIRVPSELSLAIKALGQGEEVTHFLDKEITIVHIAQTISQQVVWQSLDPAVIWDQFNDSVREFQRLREVIPRALESILRQIEAGALTVAIEIPFFKQIVNTLIIISNRLVAGLILTGMLVGSALIMGISPAETKYPFITILGVVGFIASFLLGLLIVWDVVREIVKAVRNRQKDRL